MKPFVTSETALTLVELLTALTLYSLILLLLSSTYTFGVRAYERITVEGALRDEADYMMTTILNALYELGPQDQPTQNPTDGSVTFTNTDRFGLNNHTELVAGSQVKKTLTILFKDNVIYLKKATLQPDGTILSQTSITLSHPTIHSLVIQQNNVLTNIQIIPIGQNNHYTIKITLSLQDTRFPTLQTGTLTLQSQFSM